MESFVDTPSEHNWRDAQSRHSGGIRRCAGGQENSLELRRQDTEDSAKDLMLI